MLKSLKLEKYRGFDLFSVNNLARVNLLVGKNNAGKTSILEAVYLLASSGDPMVLSRIASSRGEVVYEREDIERPRIESFPDVTHLFRGHRLEERAGFSLTGDNGMGQVEIRVLPISETSLGQNRTEDLFGDSSGIEVPYALQIRRTKGYPQEEVIPLTAQGALVTNLRRRPSHVHTSSRTNLSEMAMQFITPYSLETRSMSEMWNQVVRDREELAVYDALRIIEPMLESIVFLSTSAPVYRRSAQEGVLVGLKGSEVRVPLGSFGDGMRRLLALSLSLFRTRNGILLIDEIDTGLHYSVMGEMWRLVVEAARQFNVTVFATTHSFDCIRGLSWFCESYPDDSNLVSLQKIEPSLGESVALSGGAIVTAENFDLEVR